MNDKNVADTTISADEIQAIVEKYDRESATRKLPIKWNKAVTVVAVLFSSFQVYTAIFGSLAPQLQRSIHLTFALLLAYTLYPFRHSKRDKSMHIIDYVLIGASSFVALYWIFNYEPIILRAGDVTRTDFVMGIIAVALTLEATRRVCGLPVFILGIIALLYCFFGKYVPGEFMDRGFSVQRIIAHMYLSTEGMLGIPIGVVSTFVFLFLLFGAFLKRTGVGDFFNEFANSICGKYSGGPAKVAVVSSALEGTISGSSIANTVGSGSFTIPMMIKLGYKREFAAAVEAAASTGGQIMPPVMGAAAFLMAEFTGIPYIKVCIAAALPAILYFTGIFISVHIEAVRLGLKGLPENEVPKFWTVLWKKGVLFVPVITIVVTMDMGFTPMRAGLWGIVSAILAGAIFPESRMSLKKFIEAFEDGARTAVAVAVVSATAGIVVGTISLTGLGLKMATGLVEMAQGNQLITMFLTMISSIILGMGVPTTANYIITSTICAPALLQLGVSLIAAHLFVFYYGIIADITPPVCSAVFAGAGIAKSDPMKTGITATKLAIGAFIVPYLFVYCPELLLGSTSNVGLVRMIWVVLSAILGMYAVSSGVQGWMVSELNIFERILLFSAGLMLIYVGFITDVIGLTIILAMFIFKTWRRRSLQWNVNSAGKS
jgi:TRAP transporter 4TM/12TM fusion protein